MSTIKSTWHRSTYSSNGGTNNCVEAAALEQSIGVRDSKDLSIPHLEVKPDAWIAFLNGINES